MRIVPNAAQAGRGADLLSRYRDIEELGHPQGENRDFGRNAQPNGRPGGPQSRMYVQSRIAVTVESQVKLVRKLAEAEQLGKKGHRHLPPVRVSAQHQLNSVLYRRREQTRIVRQ